MVRLPSLNMKTKITAHVELVKVGDLFFIYFPGNDGGRLIPARHIKSIVPDFKGTGAMVFLTDSDKAVKVPQTPKDIANDLIDNTEAP